MVRMIWSITKEAVLLLAVVFIIGAGVNILDLYAGNTGWGVITVVIMLVVIPTVFKHWKARQVETVTVTRSRTTREITIDSKETDLCVAFMLAMAARRAADKAVEDWTKKPTGWRD